MRSAVRDVMRTVVGREGDTSDRRDASPNLALRSMFCAIVQMLNWLSGPHGTTERPGRRVREGGCTSPVWIVLQSHWGGISLLERCIAARSERACVQVDASRLDGGWAERSD